MVKKKKLNKLKIELPQQNKGMYVKLKANITLSGEGLKAFSLRLGIRQGCPFLLPDSTVLENQAKTIR